jgi:hypothetical protein
MEPRMARMRDVRAPTVRSRTHRWSLPGGGGWSATKGDPRQRRRTQPPLQAYGVSRYPTRTPSAAPSHSDTRGWRPLPLWRPLTAAGGHHGRVAQLDPDQLAALRRLRAAFGLVLVLEVREHEPGRDLAPDQAPRPVDDDHAPEPDPPDRR